MPALRNPRQEKFCRELIKLGVAARAYLAAGYRASRRAYADSNASILKRNQKVQMRLQELMAMATDKHLVTVETIADQLDAAYAMAMTEGEAGAAVSAAMGKAKLYGLVVNKSESGKPGEFESMQSTGEIISAVRNELGDEAAESLAKLFEDSPRDGAPETPRLLSPPLTNATFESSEPNESQ